MIFFKNDKKNINYLLKNAIKYGKWFVQFYFILFTIFISK